MLCWNEATGEKQKNLDLSTREGHLISEAENSNIENNYMRIGCLQFQITDCLFVTDTWFIKVLTENVV